MWESHGNGKQFTLDRWIYILTLWKLLQKEYFLAGVKLLCCVIYHQISKTSGQLFYFPFKNQGGEVKANLTFTLLFVEVKIMFFSSRLCHLYFLVQHVDKLNIFKKTSLLPFKKWVFFHFMTGLINAIVIFLKGGQMLLTLCLFLWGIFS